MNPHRSASRRRILILLVAAALLAFLYGNAQGEAWFVEQPLSITAYRIFDLGVVDLNQDHLLDVFTANCWALPGIFLGDGQGGFSGNQLTAYQMDHDPLYPGWEVSTTKPVMSDPGLYLFWYKKVLYLRAYKIEQIGPIAGTLTFCSTATVQKTSSFSANVTEKQLPSGCIETTLNFSVGREGRLLITPRFIEIPYAFQIQTPAFPLNRIYIGRGLTSPPASIFTLKLTDRHGMAWSDFNGDDLLDVFIARGGLKGEMDQFPFTVQDELMVNQGSLMENQIAGSGIFKDRFNRGRQAAWVDFNGDGRLDLSIGNLHTPNQLFQQTSEGDFVDVAPSLGLDFAYSGPYVWLDFDNDGDMDLLIVRTHFFQLGINQSGVFELRSLGTNTGGFEGKLLVFDYQLDGDLDVFAISPLKNTLLVNQAGTYTLVEPSSVGLPDACKTASFVDYDNSGVLDLHAVPGGIYRQLSDYHFQKTDRLANAAPADAADARMAWFDMDNDGFRDLLLAYTTDPAGPFLWKARLYKNMGSASHWLQVELVGAPGNRQAIGARVEVTAGGIVQLQEVGNAEGSHYSQGHYRLYFGLGKNKAVQKVRVSWPDGLQKEMNDLPADQLLIIPK